jgi:hypothetical protein
VNNTTDKDQTCGNPYLDTKDALQWPSLGVFCVMDL